MMTDSLGMTFEEYTEQRIEDWKSIQNYYPELNVDVSGFRRAIPYKNHIEQCKEKIEIMLNRKITWKENDLYQDLLMRNIADPNVKKELTEKMYSEKSTQYGVMINEILQWETEGRTPNTLDFIILVRLKFCEMIGVEYTKEEWECYLNGLKTSIEINHNLRKSVEGDNEDE